MQSKLCHGDFHVLNLILSGDKTVVIDWVDATAGNPCADAYRSYLLYSQFSDDLAGRYLKLYCHKSGLSADEIMVWAPIIAGARLSENIPTDHANRLLRFVRQQLGSA